MAQTIKLIGSKKRLSKQIEDYITTKIGKNLRVIDVMAGAGNVSIALKKGGHLVLANDQRPFAQTILSTYIGLDGDTEQEDGLEEMISALNELPGTRGYFTKTFAEEARYFQVKNAMRIDSIRGAIEMVDQDALRRYLITSLLLAADRVDSTVGVWMAYLKQPSPRSFNDLKLLPPTLIPGKGWSSGYDVFDPDFWRDVEAAGGWDVTYIDSPYDGHSYAGNYHVLDTITLNDQPDTYGVAKKRVDVRNNKSPFNSKRNHHDALKRLFQQVPTEHVVVSYSNEGIATVDEVEAMLREHGEVEIMEFKHDRYIGSRIGQHNRKGERIGEPTHIHNTEYLFHLKKDKKS